MNRILQFRQPRIAIGIALILSLVMVLGIGPALALPQGDAITDSRTILRQSMPLTVAEVRDLDEAVVAVDGDLKYNRWSAVRRDVREVEKLIDRESVTWLSELDPEEQAKAQSEINQLREDLSDLYDVTKNRRIRAKGAAREVYDQVVDTLGDLETHWQAPFSMEIPEQFTALPQLRGRAQVEMETTKGTMVITLDGYSAPITAGNFADLVQKGFYDDIPIDRLEDFYLIQMGDPEGPEEGYVDPATGEMRTIPMEIRIKGEETPIYGMTLSEAGFWDAEPVLPFSAEGTVAMARYPADPNSASSQFFIFFAEPDLTPAGLNLMDGNYAVFGYVTEGINVIYKLKLEDRILNAHLISGQENLVNAG